MHRILQWFSNPPPDAPRATILLRLMAGSVFLWEGILKFVYANQGVGRFTKLGFPFPDFTASSVGGLEIVGGLLILLGLGTRFVAVPFLIEMVVAMLSTKIGLYLGTSPLPLPPSPPVTGFWAVLHEVRSEYAQLLTSAFLLWAGPGPWSVDVRWARQRTEQQKHQNSSVEIASAPTATRSFGSVCEPAGSARAGRSLISAAGSNGRDNV
jgi:putative oxidoreductase